MPRRADPVLCGTSGLGERLVLQVTWTSQGLLSSVSAWAAAPGFLGTAGPCGCPGVCCWSLVPCTRGLLAGREQQSLLRKGRGGMEGRKRCGNAPLHQTRRFLHPVGSQLSCEGFCAPCPLFSWAKHMHVSTALASCAVRQEQTRRIKGAPLGEEGVSRGWSVTQLSGIPAFLWWIRLCRCFVAWLTKSLLFSLPDSLALLQCMILPSFLFLNRLKMQYRAL